MPVSVGFDASSSRVRLTLGAFTVPVGAPGLIITHVDVAKLYGIMLPIEPQALTFPLPGGGIRAVTARATTVTSQVTPGRLILTVQVGF